MTRRERMERKIEKREEWAKAREAKAAQAFDRADLREEKSGIPLGQPILVGHHSERRHRAAIDRAHRAMGQAVEHSKMAREHASKAEGLAAQLESSIYDDDPDAIEQLEARIAQREAERERNNAINKIVRAAPRAQLTEAKIEQLKALGMSDATARAVFEKDCFGGVGISAYVNQNLGSSIKRDRDRLARLKTNREHAARAEQNGGVLITRNGAYNCVTFAEKPERSTINTLKAAGYRWAKGYWIGTNPVPDCVTA